MSNLPAKIQGYLPATLEDMQRLANVFVESGLCDTTEKESRDGITPKKKLAVMVMKIQAGLELGVPPLTAISNINIIKGKFVVGYQLLLALVRKAQYDYKVIQRDESGAAIEFFNPSGKSLGVSTFTAKDAQQAGLMGDNYRKIPRNMYFARAVSNGINAYCPEVTKGSIYTHEDFGGDSGDDYEYPPDTEVKVTVENSAANIVDTETGEVITETDPQKIPITAEELQIFIGSYESKGLDMNDIFQAILKIGANDGVSLSNLRETFTHKHLAAVKTYLDEKCEVPND